MCVGAAQSARKRAGHGSENQPPRGKRTEVKDSVSDGATAESSLLDVTAMTSPSKGLGGGMVCCSTKNKSNLLRVRNTSS